ncbi:hypothetical protein BOX15_Mlig025752g1, partial [Macrostomum lignano]
SRRLMAALRLESNKTATHCSPSSVPAESALSSFVNLERIVLDLESQSISRIELPAKSDGIEKCNQSGTLTKLLHLKPVVKLTRLKILPAANRCSSQIDQPRQWIISASILPYTPQVGDLAVYLADAHTGWFNNYRQKHKLVAPTYSSKLVEEAPDAVRPERAVVRVRGIRYVQCRKPDQPADWLMRLRLRIIGENCAQSKSTVPEFIDVTWPLIGSNSTESSSLAMPQFLVPHSVYNTAMQMQWHVGDKCRYRCCHGNNSKAESDRLGTVLGFDKRNLVSGWRCVRVQWDDEVGEDRVSPWEMLPLDQDNATKTAVLSTTESASSRRSESLLLDRMLSCLQECRRPCWRRLFGLAFLADRRPRRCQKSWKSNFPLSVSMVTKRLRLGQYRHSLAVLHDLAALCTNYRKRWRLAYRTGSVRNTAEAAIDVKRASLLCDSVAVCCSRLGQGIQEDENLRQMLLVPGREGLLPLVTGVFR